MSQTKAELVNGLSVNAAADDAVTVNSSGNVGIGDPNPDSLLHIGKGTNADDGAVTITIGGNSSNARQASIIKNNVGGNDRALEFHATTASNNHETIKIFTDGTTERMRIDSSGNVGIATTSGGGKLAILSNSSSYEGLELQTPSGDGSGEFHIGVHDSGGTGGRAIVFRRGGADGMDTESMRINNNGQLLVNRTSLYYSDVRLEVGNDTGNVASFVHGGSGDNYTLIVRNNRASGGTAATQIFFAADGGTNVGSIQSNGSGTSYNTSSDYRLKENVTTISDGITRLKTLKPYRFNFKVDKDTTVDGFLAHEVTAVPEAITGTKDEVDSDNNPVYQGIDQSKIVPLLVAAVQEEIAKREALESRIAALEAA